MSIFGVTGNSLFAVGSDQGIDNSVQQARFVVNESNQYELQLLMTDTSTKKAPLPLDQTLDASSNVSFNSLQLFDPLSTSHGGTGSKTISGARSNLGLSDMALQNSSSVNINGGSVKGLSEFSCVSGTASAFRATTLDVSQQANVNNLNSTNIQSIGDTLNIGNNSTYVNVACSNNIQTVNIGGNNSTGITTINIGGAGDQVNIGGNLSYITSNNLQVDNKIIQINKNSAGTGTARGAAVSIRDNNNDTQAYIKVNETNGQSFEFKAPEGGNFVLSTPVLSSNSTLLINTNNLSDVSASEARTNLGLGTISIQNSDSVNIGDVDISGEARNQGERLAITAGYSWTTRTSAVDNVWTSVCYGNGLFTAVSNTGTNNRVMTSPDGINWISRTSASNNNWSSVCYGNGIFVAVAQSGTNNRVMNSSDGITWTTATSAADNTWTSVCYGIGTFVAVSSSGSNNRVMSSLNGTSWTIRTSAANNDWNSVCYGRNLYVAVSSTGTGNRVMTSPDGTTWTIRTSAADNSWWSVCYGNGLFVAVGFSNTNNGVMTSPDGINWTTRTTPANNNWNSVCYGDGLFIAVSTDGGSNHVMTSPDGITWTLRTTFDNNWWSVCYGNGLFVSVSQTGTGNRVLTSGFTKINESSLQTNNIIQGAQTMRSSLTVAGAATLSGTLGVTGATTLTSFTASTTARINGNTDLCGNLRVLGTTDISGATTIRNTLGVLGNVDLSSNLIVRNRIGINNTNPLYGIDSNGDINISSGSVYRINGVAQTLGSQWITSGSNISYNSGNVGIGTNTPAFVLDVSGAIRSNTGLFTDVGTIGGGGVVHQSLRTGGTIRFGIGLSNSESGSNSGSDFSIWRYNDAGSLIGPTLYAQRSTGNIGIGTSGPNADLEISDSATSNFTHTIRTFIPNMTSGSSNGNAIVFGVNPSTRNSGYISFKYPGGAGSTSNLISIGLWGVDDIITANGNSDVAVKGLFTFNNGINRPISSREVSSIRHMYGAVNMQTGVKIGDATLNSGWNITGSLGQGDIQISIPDAFGAQPIVQMSVAYSEGPLGVSTRVVSLTSSFVQMQTYNTGTGGRVGTDTDSKPILLYFTIIGR